MQLRTIEGANLKNKRIIMRVDYNISYGKTLRIVDDTRIVHTLPTINYLLDHGCAKLTLISHLGKPNGRIVPTLSLAPVAPHLSELLGQPVSFCGQGKINLLENLRFDAREEEGSEEYAAFLAQGHDLYINEAFSESHRNVTSMTYLPRLLPSFAGFGLIEEVTTIIKAVESPARPFVVIVGGAKIKDKIGLLQVLSKKADTILVGGGMANTFLAATGMDLGDSLVEPAKFSLAKDLLANKYGNAKFVLPIDFVLDGTAIKDIGEQTIEKFAKIIAEAKTIIWNGPMGMFEDQRFATGTDKLYQAITDNEEAMVIVGGGDTLSAIKNHTHLSRIDFISTGGGAMLELIEKGTLPALAPLIVD